MHKLIKTLIYSVLAFLLLVSCKEDSTSTFDENVTGTLTIHLTDAPADFEAVNITFSEIAVHIDSQWVTLHDTARTINLLDWSNGRSVIIASGDVPAGKYNQLRLIIDDAQVVIDSVSHAMDVPSSAQSGLKINLNFDIVEGSSYEVTVDFDACRSVVVTGPPSDPGYKLKPTLRAVSNAVSGSISGQVTNPQNSPVAFAIAGGDTVTGTFVDAVSGEFTLAFLPAGCYTVTIEDIEGFRFVTDEANVISGADLDLGWITLE